MSKIPWWIQRGAPNPSQGGEARKKISEAMKGHKPWNKDKLRVYTEETLELMSKKAKERWGDENYQKMMCDAFKGHEPWNKGLPPEEQPNFGKHPSEESKHKISVANKGKTGHYPPWNKGLRYKSPTISEALKGKFEGENNPHYGKHHSTKTLELLSGLAKTRFKNIENHPFFGKHHSDETKTKLRKSRMKQIIPHEYTNIERIIEDVLKKVGTPYIHSFNLGDRFLCDFAIPSSKLLIECDGDYWHSLPNNIKRDKRKNAYARKRGWGILRLSEHKILNNLMDCENLIIQNLEKLS